VRDFKNDNIDTANQIQIEKMWEELKEALNIKDPIKRQEAIEKQIDLFQNSKKNRNCL
jgi:hypothetical protein